jgi:2,4-dienoyl-CoA reductase-like NADH-dependent reductase (Old Yellow Enzyme family)
MIEVCRTLAAHGVDLVDCSAGGVMPGPDGWPAESPGFQVGYAERIRMGAGVATGAVGRISSPEQADEIVRSGQADLVLLGRELLRDPYWPLHAAEALGVEMDWPQPYVKARR